MYVYTDPSGMSLRVSVESRVDRLSPRETDPGVPESQYCAHLQVISPFYLYFNTKLIVYKHEYWRLLTNFLYFGNVGIDLIFHLFFLLRYCKSLEEGSFRNRSADFLWMLVFGGLMLIIMAPFAKVQFLGTSLNFMMVYVWSRRNPDVPLSFLGIFTFGAAYLPWVLMGFSVLIGSSPVTDILGMISGHTYYYLEDVYPNTQQGRDRRFVQTPRWFQGAFSALVPSADGHIRRHVD